MRSDRPGVALMLVLWLVVVLAVTAATVVARGRSEANTVVAYRSRALARAAAVSGVQEGLAALEREYGAVTAAPDRVAALQRVQDRLEAPGPRVLGDARFRVVVEDLTGRVPINTADYSTLIRLFSLAAGEERAPALAAAVLDWIDADETPRPGGAEAPQYAEAGSAYRPLNRRFQRLEELARLPGVDSALARVLAENATVYGAGLVNVNTAPPLALAAGTGMTLAAAERLVELRRQGPFLGMDQVRSATGLTGGFVPVSLVPARLVVIGRGWAEGHPYTREARAVVEVRGLSRPDGPELVVVGWEERDL